MKLAHHTTKHSLESIIKDGILHPVYDCVWFTSNLDGEATAGLTMPEEHRARVVIESDGKELYKFNDIHGDFPHLNVGLLNMITNTDNWYVSFDEICSEDFIETSTMKDGKWIQYE